MSDFTKLAVIGHPINHSKSPLIHNEWLQRAGMSGSYEAIDIKPEELEGRVQKFIQDGYVGFNVTLPHKENMLPLCDEIDDTAQKIGAVNTVVIKQGKLFGFNTDAYGFTKNIKANSSFYFYEKNALVLGAGGASRAVIQGLLDEDVTKIYLSNRTKHKAEELKGMSEDKITIIDWEERQSTLQDVDLLVNTTSLGMIGKDSLEINLNDLKKTARVTDIVYTPIMTNLLRQARDNGHDIILGVGMLLYQAQKSFEIWTGHLPDVDDIITNKVLV